MGFNTNNMSHNGPNGQALTFRRLLGPLMLHGCFMDSFEISTKCIFKGMFKNFKLYLIILKKKKYLFVNSSLNFGFYNKQILQINTRC